MELPPYHLPTLKATWLHMYERAKLYIIKAGTFIMAASILIWFITAYPYGCRILQKITMQ